MSASTISTADSNLRIAGSERSRSALAGHRHGLLEPEVAAAADTGDVKNAPRAQPLYFGSAERPILGWWHLVDHPAPCPVVICAPFGLEDLSAYRSLRHLAQSLSAAGIPSLRFDYPGCGDSAGDDDDADQTPVWLQSVHAAADLARSLTGAQRVALVGVRLGALLAATCAAQRDDMAAFVAIAPPASGRAFVRECRMLGAAAGVGHARQDGGTQAAGFVLSGPTCDSLSRLALPKADATVASTALIVDRDDMAPTSWADQLSRLGSRVDHEVLPGFAAMVDSPHYARIPMVMMAHVVGWLAQATQAVSKHAQPSSTREIGAPYRADEAVLTVAGSSRVREHPLMLVAQPLLVAQLTEPEGLADARTPGDRQAVLILNTGSERRIGPNRLWVPFARVRAARGDVVLRLDQAGVGDSELRPGDAENDVYGPQVLNDVAAGLAWLRDRRGITHCTVMGVCSGAYHGFQAALAGLPVHSILSINPLIFHWVPNIPLRDTAAHPGGQLAHLAHARRGLRDPKKWLKLLRGKVDVGGLVRVIIARNIRRMKLATHAMARALGRPFPKDLAVDVQNILDRGITMQFVFSEGDPGRTILLEETGLIGRRLLANRSIKVDVISHADHTFTATESRTRLRARLHQLLDASASARTSNA